MNSPTCPSCQSQVQITGAIYIGKQFRCPHCGQRLALVQDEPPELDFLYDEEDDDNYGSNKRRKGRED